MSATRIANIEIEITGIEKIVKDIDKELEKSISADEKYLSEKENQLALKINLLNAHEAELNNSLEKTWYRSNVPTPENKKIVEVLRQIENIKTVLMGHQKIIHDRLKKTESQSSHALVDKEIADRSKRRELLIASIRGEPSSKGFSFTRASDAAARAEKASEIDLQTAVKLLRKSAAFDALKRKGSDGTIDSIKKTAKELAGDIEDIVTSVVSSTANAGVKSVFLVFGWPFILPMKLVSFVSNGISTGSRSAQAFMQSLDDDLEKIVDGSKKPLGYLLYVVPGLIIKPLKWTAAALKKGTEVISKFFDTDRWFENSPMTQGFIAGGLGTGIIIAIAIASVFTFGIPIAAVAVGAGLAALGGIIAGGAKYGQLRKEQKERNKLELSDSEEAQLIEFAARKPVIIPLLTKPKVDLKEALKAIQEESEKVNSKTIEESNVKKASEPHTKVPAKVPEVVDNLEHVDAKHSKDKKWGKMQAKLEKLEEHLKTEAEKREKEHAALAAGDSKPAVLVTSVSSGRPDNASSNASPDSTIAPREIETPSHNSPKRKSSDTKK